MKSIISFLLIFIWIGASAQTNPPLNIKEAVDSAFNSVEGNFAIAFKDLTNPGNTLYANAHEDFHAASTMKTPVMIEVFKQAEQGKFELTDSLLVKNNFSSIVDGSGFSLEMGRDSGEKLYSAIGEKRAIIELVRDMIIHSSNLATNILVEHVGAKNVNRSMRELGAQNIEVLRGVEDMKAYEAGLSNSTTAYDLMVILEHLANGTAVSEKADQQMLEILFDQAHREIIPAKLPQEVRVANKTGSIDGVRHDSAIVFLPDGRKYVLVLLSEEMTDATKGTEMLAGVSEFIYNHMMQKE